MNPSSDIPASPAPANEAPRPNAAAPRAPSASKSTFYFLQVVLGVAFVLATLLAFWFPQTLLPGNIIPVTPIVLESAPEVTIVPTLTPDFGRRIGLIAGHWSKDPARYDPGAVCPDAMGGLREVDINLSVATKAQLLLVNAGYEVELLEEWDERLSDYRALALVSIHADSCGYINDEATGFKVAAAVFNPHPELSSPLVTCIETRYAAITGLQLHTGSVTPDMTDYHNFREINPETPAAIIEIGFMNQDFDVLTSQQDTLAEGVAAGILCFVRQENPFPETNPTP